VCASMCNHHEAGEDLKKAGVLADQISKLVKESPTAGEDLKKAGVLADQISKLVKESPMVSKVMTLDEFNYHKLLPRVSKLETTSGVNHTFTILSVSIFGGWVLGCSPCTLISWKPK